ncbi:class I SAM-dependent methyltransferase [Christiangramia sediminis]|uniref:Class I SAM-dependent methyltransferase n=1 Tax=Christiangramia sediminis TaxID=2881336 RepID=A0A9X1RVX3_9FLAO|nr:class I SAM-dependent methyltransferase [Christiangramia sediminis]MCB7481323.1 class I SAM-dependent methyltransferase [Christiangramia sediminis]
MVSPVSLKSNDAVLIEEFNTESIINSYRELGLNVNHFFSTKSLSLYKCKSTGYRFYYPYTSIGDAHFYSELSKVRKNYYSTRWEHLQSLAYLKNKENVLEIGSGFGIYLSLLAENKINGKGLELNPQAIENNNSPYTIENKLIGEESKENPNKYDAVVMFQVLEHVPKVNSFITDALNSLKKGGKLIIGVPNNNPYLFINDKHHTLNLPPHHAGLWNKKSLKSLEKVFPLELEVIEFEPLEESYDQFINHLLSNKQNFYYRKLVNITRKLFPKLLKKILCRLIKGRNVLAVFTKK